MVDNQTCLVCDSGPGNMCACSCPGGPVWVARQPGESSDAWTVRNRAAGPPDTVWPGKAEMERRFGQVLHPPEFHLETSKLGVGLTIPMIMHCPICSGRHTDEADFATVAHHTHACQHCGHVWRPALVNTHGVQFLPGFKNS